MFAPVPSMEPLAFVSFVWFLILVSFIYFGVEFDVYHHWTSILFLFRGQLKHASGCGIFVEDPLVAFGYYLFFGRVVVSLTHFPFPYQLFLFLSVEFPIHLSSRWHLHSSFWTYQLLQMRPDTQSPRTWAHLSKS